MFTVPKETPNLQRWIISSNPENKLVWNKRLWNQFQKELHTQTTKITKPIYRGTKFPWIERGQKDITTKASLTKHIHKMIADFDSKKPVILPTITSFTTKKSSAERFASEASGFQLTKTIIMDEGYLHIIEPPSIGVDVYAELQKQKLMKLPETDELLVAKREKEILLLEGTVLIPKSRSKRTFYWTIKA